MPQVFQVLKCYKCSVFQIHQTKKSNKFECKVCGEKQSIKRHYGIGTGKDCRVHVQRLNSLRGDIDDATQNYSDEENVDSNTDEGISEKIEYSSVTRAKRSKWSTYVDKQENITENESEEPMFLGDIEVLLELPQKRKTKKFKVNMKSLTDSQDNDILNSSNYQYTNVDNNQQCYTNKSLDIKLEKVLNSIENSAQRNINYYEEPIAVNTLLSSHKRKSLQTEDKLKTISKTSKWAQFVEKDEETEVMCSKNEVNEALVETSKSDNLFSLCDDDDIDSVLNI